MTGRAVVVVGAGVIGTRQLHAVLHAGDRVVAVVDGDLDRATALAAESGASAFTSLPAAVAAVGADAVIIATPSASHLRLALDAVQLRCDVLVEKPHRVPGEDAGALATALERTGRHFAVGMTTRHWPGVRALAAALAAGEFGELLSYTDTMHFQLGPDDLPGWYFNRAVSGGGVLLTNGVHAIDRARALLGEPLELLHARLRTVFPEHETEDSAELVLTTDSGAPVLLSMLWSPVAATGAGVAVTGTRGFGRVAMDGSWSIRTDAGERSGPAIDADEPFAAQWLSFRDAEPGFGLGDLEPTLQMIENCYREVAA